MPQVPEVVSSALRAAVSEKSNVSLWDLAPRRSRLDEGVLALATAPRRTNDTHWKLGPVTKVVMSMYHEGNRKLQDRFGSTRLADRLVERLWRDRLTDEDRAFIEGIGFFFLATADTEGRPDCSFKGGPPGFVRVLAPDLIAFPDYDGNGMFKSLGNIVANPQVGLLFISMGEKPKRLRVNGRASVHLDDAHLAELPGAQAVVRIVPEHIFPNCPRYIPDMASGTPSEYLPVSDCTPREPAWKTFDAFKDVVPKRRR